jgi:lipopolysaccharide/colanic/teichoic acid biosynthesis glycosyltransferase
MEISSAAALNETYSTHEAHFTPFGRESVNEWIPWKRILDVTLSIIALILLAPVMLVTAAVVKLTSPGSVFYEQERVGLNRRTGDRRNRTRGKNLSANRRREERRVVVNFGMPFRIYKFRTMVTNAESDVPVWAKKNDSRITPVGAVLRRCRIDELPQFVNVLKGDMSIVGPRPERAYFMAQIEKDLPDFQRRLRTRPGITGLAQVEVGYTNTVEGLHDKLDLDLRYIRNLKLVEDLRILYKTVSVVITGKGAC